MDEPENPTERNIPLPIQRAVRQRCGFGCVVCGLPLYAYDHLLGWANVKRHVAEEITLLCDQHHREKTSGLLAESVVARADRNPFNRRYGTSKPYDLHFDGDFCEIDVGSNKFSMASCGEDTILAPFSIDGVPILAFILQDGHLLLNLVLFDEFNHLLLHIRNNQLVYALSPWDIELVGRNLVVREAARKILVDMVFDVPNRISIRRARLMRNGVELIVWRDRVVLANSGSEISGNSMTNCPCGFAIGPHDPPIFAMVAMPKVKRCSHDRSAVNRWIEGQFGREEPG